MTTDTSSTDTDSTDTGVTDDRAAAGWFVQAHVDQLLDNPADPRGGERDQATLVEFASSMRQVGLLQALTVVPDPTAAEGEQRFVIYAGHRRRDAARLAAAQLIAEALGHDVTADPTLATLEVDPDACGVDEVGAEVLAAAERLRWLPCLVRPDLAAAVGMQIAAGLIENGIRDGLTSGQRARAAEQLSMEQGWDLTRVAKATGLSRAQARAAAALPRLGEAAREAAYGGELSLEHAAVLDELAADGATDTELGMLARGGSMFEHHVTELRKTLRRRSAAAELRDEADRRGWVLYDEPDGYPLDSPLAPLWSLSRVEDPDAAALLPREGEDADPTQSRVASPYAAMPDHGVLLHDDPWADPRLEVVCADPDAHGYRRHPQSMLYVHPEPANEADPGAEATTGIADAVGEDPPVDAAGGDHGDQAARDETAADPGDAADTPWPEDLSDRNAEDDGERAADAERRRAQETEEAAAREEHRVDAERVEAERAERRRVEAAERAAENERLEAERAARQARKDALETATETRWRHTAGLLRTQKGAAGHAELPAVALARFPWLLGEVHVEPAAEQVAALCAEPDRDPATGAQRWSTGRITHRAVATAAAVLHQNLSGVCSVGSLAVELDEVEPALWWLDYLTARGYQPAEVETEVRGELERIVTEFLAAEHGRPATEGDDAQSDAGDSSQG